MQKYIKQSSILSEIRLLYQDHGIRSIAVEGSGDRKLINHFFGSWNIRAKQLCGWESVIALVCEANEDNNNYVLGLIDCDFHRISNNTGHTFNSIKNVIYTDQHDIEMMLFYSSSFDKYVQYWASEKKIKQFPDYRGEILARAELIGALRFYSLEHSLRLLFAEMDYTRFIDRKSCDIDIEKFIEYVLARTKCSGQPVSKELAEVYTGIRSVLETGYSQADICNGHDTLNITAIAMQCMFASFSASDANEDRLFESLFMGFSVEAFACTDLYQRLMLWISV